MTWHDFTLRIETPAFLGQDPAHGSPVTTMPFPVSSLRGPLRYWLRALLGAVVHDVDNLHRIEADVFGVASGVTGTPSRVRLRAIGTVPVDRSDNPSWLTPGQAHDRSRYDTYYLLGQGLYQDRRLTRRRLNLGVPVSAGVKIIGDAAHADLFLAALWAVQHYGGIGARARRGFGTVTVTPPQLPTGEFDLGWFDRSSTATHHDVLRVVVRALGDQARLSDGKLPPWPCFKRSFAATGQRRVASGHEAHADALARTGRLLRDFYRNRGAPGANRAQPSPEWLGIAEPFLSGGVLDAMPFVRGALGLPVVYSDRHNGVQRSAVTEPVLDGDIDGDPARRASPLWLRVFPDGDGWTLRWVAFTSVLLPDAARVRIRQTTGAAACDTRREIAKPTQDDLDGEIARWRAHIGS